jgi:drug/metabolite transporter (DMT)-like permease
MATKWRPGSAGEKEAKQNKVIVAFLVIVALGVFALEFLIPNVINDNVRAAGSASIWWNIFGGAFTLGSIIPPVIGLTSTDDTKNHARWWGILLALGIFTSAGFYAYTY